jgi:molybdenum cofactor synthesis domain-containing protein
MARTAASLVIGNEILSGKIQDTNTHDLARFLRALGVELRRVVVIPDELDAIAREVNALRATHDLVFTSGGIGPTHDDVTIEAIATAFGRTVLRDAHMERVLREHYGDRCTEDHLRMASIVEGTHLYRGPQSDAPWPAMVIENVHVLPGVPQIYRMNLDLLRDRLRGPERSFVLESVLCRCDEPSLKAHIDAVVERFPDVSVGSYPKFFHEEYSVKVTFDGRDPARVAAARQCFVDSLPEGTLVRVERE